MEWLAISTVPEPGEPPENESCCHLHCGSSAALSLGHQPATCVPDCRHSILCWLVLRSQDFSIISFQCPLMTHHPDKGHLNLCREKLPSWEVLLNGCGLQETRGAQTGSVTHTELSLIRLRLAQEPPTSLEPGVVFLAQTPRLQALDSTLQNYSLPESSFGICQNPGRGFVDSLFHSAFSLPPLLVELLEPRLNFSPISSKDQCLARVISALERLGRSQTPVLALSLGRQS